MIDAPAKRHALEAGRVERVTDEAGDAIGGAGDVAIDMDVAQEGGAVGGTGDDGGACPTTDDRLPQPEVRNGGVAQAREQRRAARRRPHREVPQGMTTAVERPRERRNRSEILAPEAEVAGEEGMSPRAVGTERDDVGRAADERGRLG